MDILTIFSIVALAGLIHAGFHLNVSVLTLLSGHTLSREKSHLKLVKLVFSFIFGVFFMTTMLFASFSFIIQSIFTGVELTFVWLVLIGILISTGLTVWLFYYRKPHQKLKSVSGTEMWIPRSFAKYLDTRARKTRHSAEAFSLGMTSTYSELLFILAPLLAAVFAIINLPSAMQLLAMITYLAISMLPLLIFSLMIGGGTSIAEIQIWREKNKHFFQFVVGFGLMVLAGFIYVHFVTPTVGGLV